MESPVDTVCLWNTISLLGVYVDVGLIFDQLEVCVTLDSHIWRFPFFLRVQTSVNTSAVADRSPRRRPFSAKCIYGQFKTTGFRIDSKGIGVSFALPCARVLLLACLHDWSEKEKGTS